MNSTRPLPREIMGMTKALIEKVKAKRNAAKRPRRHNGKVIVR